MLERRDHKYFAVAWSILASVACLALTVRPVQSQASSRIDSVPVLDSAHLLGTVAALAADSMEGRLAGSRGGEKAGDAPLAGGGGVESGAGGLDWLGGTVRSVLGARGE